MTKVAKILLLSSLLFNSIYAQIEHPVIHITKSALQEIKQERDNYEIFSNSVQKTISNIDIVLEEQIDVPVPKDPAGGYTHKKHKENYTNIYNASLLYQITGENKYADYVKEVLLKYSDLYPKIDLHPVEKSYAPGRLFWQALNDAVWLVYTSVAYDCVSEYLTPDEKDKIVNNLLIPHANFLSVESPQIFNRVHNHGVWAAAAVGMTGLAIDNDELVERALFGIDVTSGKPYSEKDNKEIGFFNHLDKLFSPDGYYTEGPYYQRYSLLPFVLFANALNNVKPSIHIFEYRDRILEKAVVTTLQLTDSYGRFLPINDALKGMSFKAPELVFAVDILFNANITSTDKDNVELLNQLAAVAKMQNRVMLTDAGLNIAKYLSKNPDLIFEHKTIDLRDGAEGTRGGISLLRDSNSQQTALFKYSSHGLSHGHFDRLALTFYDNSEEILSDYGSVRYVNVKQKEGGRYLPENNSWAKHSIAHNTIVMNQNSHFNGKMRESEKHSPTKLYSNYSNEDFKIVSAVDSFAYSETIMQRTLLQLKLKGNQFPVILDVFNVVSENGEENNYDLPFHYNGDNIELIFDKEENLESINSLGDNYGYQHLWLKGKGFAKDKICGLTFLNKDRMYTLSHINDKLNSEILMTELGANDPDYNLRAQRSIIFRSKSKDKINSFVSLIEPHGHLNYDTEIHKNIYSLLQDLSQTLVDESIQIIKFKYANQNYTLIISLLDSDMNKNHKLKLENEEELNWTGPYLFKVSGKP